MSSAVTTYHGRAKRALLAKQNCTYWFAIGGTTAWTNESAPPGPEPGSTDISEAICFSAADTVRLCKPVSTGGDITHLGQQYVYVDDANVIADDARFLYLKAEFHPSQGQPYGNFRIVGIFSDLAPTAGHEEDTWLSPSHVADRGTLEYLNYDTVTTMSLDRYEVIPVIIEFK